MKKNNILKLLITIITISYINTTIIYAIEPFSSGDGLKESDTTPSSESGGGGNNNWKCEDQTRAGSYQSHDCGIKVSTNYRSDVFISIYDKNGNYLGNPLEIKEKKFIAGIFVGIDAYEQYTKTAVASINPTCTSTNVVLTCTKEIENKYRKNRCTNEVQKIAYNPNNKPIATPLVEVIAPTEGGGSSKPKNDTPKCDRDKSWYEETETSTVTLTVTSGSCPDGYTPHPTCTQSPCTPPRVSSCRSQAESRLNIAIGDVNPSYNAKIQDVNDVNNKNLKGIDTYVETSDTGIIPSDINSSTIRRTLIKKFKYNPQQPCINVKTGAIRYINFNSDSKCNNDELTIKNMTIKDDYGNNSNIGMYYIPLNAKSNSEYKYILEANSNQKHEPDICKSIIENYKNDGRWKVVLLDEDKQPFDSTTSVEDAKLRVSKGCYYATTVNFNVEQKFYVESPSKKIEGYRFYFKPIDVSNPFPNGISSTSIWNGLLNTTNNKLSIKDADNKITEIDLDDSFKNITYIANVKNVNNIRNYNNNHFYTSWENMNKDGRSDFINNGYVQRNGIQSYYKLGCGPANADWEECK